MYPEHNQLDPDNPDCREESAYPAAPIPSMVGRNSSLNVSILLTIVTMAFLLGLQVTTTSLVQKEPGQVEERKRQLQSFVRSLYLPNDGGSNRGVGRYYRLVPSCSLTNVLSFN